MLVEKAYEIIREVSPILTNIYGVKPKVSKIEISNRFTRVFGQANNKFEIKLSGTAYHGHHESKAFRNTVIHEFCHLYDYLLHSRFGHGETWSKMMNQCGEQANRFFTKEKSEEIGYVKPVRKLATYPYYCYCRSLEFSSKRHSMAKRGYTYRCNLCKFVFSPYDIRSDYARKDTYSSLLQSAN